MILIRLDEATRDELQALHRQDLPSRARYRLEMVMLSAVAWAPARIAAHTGYCTATVGAVLKDFLDRGTAALFPHHTGPPPELSAGRPAAYRMPPSKCLRSIDSL
jgi:hypothetical protein